MKMTGVYAIVNLVNGKKYVGSAAESFNRRIGSHRRELNKNKHHSRHLQSAWNTYGQDAFEVRIQETTTPELAVAVEQTFIDAWKTADPRFGYNTSPTAGNCRGMSHTEETKARMSAAKKGKPLSEKTKARMSVVRKGKKMKPRSDETRARVAAARRGRPITPKDKAKSMYVRVRVSKSERAEIMRRAKASKFKTESAWIRKRLLGDD